jgi:hypothetical protein
MIISDILPYTDAFMAVWYPGTEGDGIAEVLFGDFKPSGQLTHSWPKNMDQIPINYGDYYYDPLFEYKHGHQYFPESDSAESLLPYAAISIGDGKRIVLSLSDGITSLEYESGDFTVKLDDLTVPDMVVEVTISDFDESILYLDLNSQIQQTDYISLSYSGEGISSSNLILESFNDLYVCNMVTDAPGGIYEVPGKVEAENYFDMYGIQTEPCSDIGGGLNVGYIEAGDWMKYYLTAKESGFYSLSGRISGYEPGTLKFEFNDSIQAYLSYTATNGWQNWQDFSTEVYLEEGDYTMEVIAQSQAFNINYYRFELEDGIRSQDPFISAIKAYPNPASTSFRIDFLNAGSTSIRMRLVDITGNISHHLYDGNIDPGSHSFDIPLDNDLPPGLYFIEITDNVKRYFVKLIKN